MVLTNQILKSIRIWSKNDERIWSARLKIEGGEEIAESVSRLVNAGIPVMGHLGLTPQSIYQFGTYKVRAKEDAEAEKLLNDAKF